MAHGIENNRLILKNCYAVLVKFPYDALSGKITRIFLFKVQLCKAEPAKIQNKSFHVESNCLD